MTYNEIIQQAGKQLERELQTTEGFVLKNDDIKSIKITFNAPLIGTVMKQFEVVTKKKIENLNSECSLKIIAKYGEHSAEKVYHKLYIKEEPTYDANDRSYTYILGDSIIKFMKDYKPITITYPTDIGSFAQKLIESLGFVANFTHSKMANYSMTLEKDPYENVGDFTFRNALDDIAQANGVLFAVNDKAEVIIVDYKSKTAKTINDDILKNQNISMGEHYGPINTLVLSRSAESDNLYYPAELPEKPVEYKITDNVLMNGNNRADFMPGILNNIQGVEYDIYDCELVGYGDFEPLNVVTIETMYDGNKLVYNSYVFNYECTVADGYGEAIYTEMPENTNTNYKTAGTDDRVVKSVSLIVDKQNNVINGLAQEIDSQSEKIASVELSVDGLKTEVKEISPYGEVTSSDIEINIVDIALNGINSFIIESALDNENLNFIQDIKLVILNDEDASSNEYILSPSSHNNILYAKNGVKDQLIYKNHAIYFYHRISQTYPNDPLDSPYEEKIQDLKIENVEGSIWLYLTSPYVGTPSFNINYNKNTGYATTTQLSQTAREINASVSEQISGVEGQLSLKVGRNENNQIITMINASASTITLSGGTKIQLTTAGKLLISAGNFRLDSGGNTTILGGSIYLEADTGDDGIELHSTTYNINTEYKGYGIQNYKSGSLDSYWNFQTGNFQTSGYVRGHQLQTETDVINVSDERYKENITPINEQKSLTIIKELEPIEYTFKEHGNRYHRGLSAQKVKEVLNKNGIIDEVYFYNKSEDKYSLGYSELIPDLINCIKAQQKEIDDLKNRVEQLEKNMV